MMVVNSSIHRIVIFSDFLNMFSNTKSVLPLSLFELKSLLFLACTKSLISLKNKDILFYGKRLVNWTVLSNRVASTDDRPLGLVVPGG